MFNIEAVKRLDNELYLKVKNLADEKFGSKNSYVKNLWIQKEYTKRGGRSDYDDNARPSKEDIFKLTQSFINSILVSSYIEQVKASARDMEEQDELIEDLNYLRNPDNSFDENFLYLTTPWSSDAATKKKEKKTLNKPFRTPGGPKKFSVYVKNDKGNVVKVNFGDPNMEIRRDDPARRKSFRARHNCENPGPRWKARYWSCRFWSRAPVSSMASITAEYPDIKYTEETDD
jgi:hypothetical protein